MEVHSWTHESWIHVFLANPLLWSTLLWYEHKHWVWHKCRGTDVRDQTVIAWYRPQYSMGNNCPNMSVTELWRSSSASSEVCRVQRKYCSFLVTHEEIYVFYALMLPLQSQVQDIERTKALGKFVSQFAADSLHEMLLAVWCCWTIINACSFDSQCE